MENLIITIACIALILLGTASFATSSLNSVDTLSSSWKQAEAKAQEINRTDISAIDSQTLANGSEIDITIRNEGNTSLTSFNKWDVIIRYQNGSTQWIPYSGSTPGWSVSGIYLNGNPEIFEPNILNPDETMVINIRLSPLVSENTTNLAIISTDNGVNIQTTFGW